MQQTYSPMEAARKLGISRAYVYKLAKLGKLKPVRRKPLLFTEEEIQNYYGRADFESRKEASK